ncbi:MULTISPECIES: RadC family protein [Dysgonomonas]|jgi:DNA repair protein RadC|uniref:RadC family protein n=1 Tax=Dysgonomonas TaxID=156973 RepID=UPI0018834E54|nr:DNA repair protein RadC [Dysgonomonas sp. GY75]MBF0648853.1 DNA repair protein RadC [Dysgonomonas sp. GY75]
MENKTKLNIKDWAEEDRPREKMLLKGVGALSDAELLGILIGSGNKNETAVELAQRILHSVSNNLNILGKQEIKDLIKNFNGIGEAKAITIAAAMELGKRRKLSEVVVQPQITSSDTVYQIFHPVLADLKHEEVWVLLLNRANKVLKKIQVSKGGVAGTVVDIRMIMKEAIDSLASAMVLCHNHPSGNSNPSGDDDNITRRLKEAGQIMDVRLLDHIIVCDHSYYSYMDRGRM